MSYAEVPSRSKPISWGAYENIGLTEKIRRTERAIKLFSVNPGPISQAMAENKRLLLKELKKGGEV
jgi:hypothetical protein